jgi:hypothetical protein
MTPHGASRGSWRGASWGLLLGLLAVAAHASPQASGVAEHGIRESLQVRNTPRCLRLEALHAQLVHWLGRDSIDARLRMVVEEDSTSRASFQLWRDETLVAERRFTQLPERCEEVLAAVGLALALAVDITVLERLQQGGAATPPAPAVFPRALRYAVTLELLAGWGVLPTHTFAGAVGLERRLLAARLPWLTGRLSLLGTPGGRASVGPGGVHTSLLAGRLDFCGTWGTGNLTWQPCMGATLGRLGSRGTGFEANLSAASPWSAAVGRLALRLPAAGPVFFQLQLEFLAALTRPVLQVLNTEEAPLYQRALPGLGAQAGIGIGVPF